MTSSVCNIDEFYYLLSPNDIKTNGSAAAKLRVRYQPFATVMNSITF